MAELKQNSKQTLFINAQASNIFSGYSIDATQAALYEFDPHSQNWLEKARFSQERGIHPKYRDRVTVGYYANTQQNMKFVIYDIGAINVLDHPLTSYKVVAEVKFQLSELVNAIGHKKQFDLCKQDTLQKIDSHGSVEFTVDVLNDSDELVHVEIRLQSLPAMDLNGLCDPYIIIEARTGDQEEKFLKVHQTEVVYSNKNPDFKRFTIPLTAFCFGDKNRLMRYTIYDKDRIGKDEKIGTVEVSPNQILGLQYPSFLIQSEHSQEARMIFVKFAITSDQSVAHAIKPKLALTFAIDCSATNGNPNDASSLHYLTNGGNSYVEVLNGFTTLLAPQLAEQKVGLYGVCATLPGQMQPSLVFPMGNSAEVAVNDVGSVYCDKIRQITPYNMCQWNEAVTKLKNQAVADFKANKDVHHLLVILTTGRFDDFSPAMTPIVEASSLRFSVLVVGIGNGPFAKFEPFNGDFAQLKDAQGHAMKRKNVHFINKATADARFFKQLALQPVVDDIAGFHH